MTEKEAKKVEMTMNFNEIILNIDSLKTNFNLKILNFHIKYEINNILKTYKV